MDKDAFFAEISRFGTGAAIIGLVNLISSYLFVTCLNYAAESQVFRIRTLFLQSVLRQDVGWYDVHPTGSFASRMADDLNKLQVRIASCHQGHSGDFGNAAKIVGRMSKSAMQLISIRF